MSERALTPGRPSEHAIVLGLSTVDEAADDFRRGRPVVILLNHTHPGANGQTELIAAPAELATAETVNAVTAIGRGMLYLALMPEKCETLRFREQAHGPVAWTRKLMTSIDARDVRGTGISAEDRAHTVRLAISPDAEPQQFVSPGHVLPLRAERDGTLVRAGHTEAAVDLARIAGLAPAAIMSELLSNNGDVAEGASIALLAATHGLKVVSIAQIIAYRRTHEQVIRPVASALLPTPMGDFLATGFVDSVSGVHHFALTRADLSGGEPPLVAIEFECRLGCALRAVACDCQARQDEALARISDEGRGAWLQLSRPSGPGVVDSVLASCSAYRSDRVAGEAIDPYSPQAWSAAEIASGMLAALGVSRLRLLTSLPIPSEGLGDRGIEVTERVPTKP